MVALRTSATLRSKTPQPGTALRVWRKNGQRKGNEVFALRTFAFWVEATLLLHQKKMSPKKTYEGLFGGILFSGLYSYLICVIFNINFLIIVCFIIGSIFALIGDLFISNYKRKIGIKDTGKILPGLGGILDRIDSHLLATPVKVILISQIL